MVGEIMSNSLSVLVQGVDEFSDAMVRIGATAQLRLGRAAGRTDEGILLGLVETLQPEWTIVESTVESTVEDAHYLICRIGSWHVRQFVSLAMWEEVAPTQDTWSHLQRRAMLQYADWILDSRSEGVTEQASGFGGPVPYRADPERIVAPEDIPGVTWRDRERWIRELDTTPDEYPHDESGGMSSEELMEAIGMAVDDWKKEEK